MLGPVADLADDVWHDTIETNLSGVFYCIRAAAAHDPAAVRPHRGDLVRRGPGWHAEPGPLWPSKWGLIGLVKTVALETATDGSECGGAWAPSFSYILSMSMGQTTTPLSEPERSQEHCYAVLRLHRRLGDLANWSRDSIHATRSYSRAPGPGACANLRPNDGSIKIDRSTGKKQTAVFDRPACRSTAPKHRCPCTDAGRMSSLGPSYCWFRLAWSKVTSTGARQCLGAALSDLRHRRDTCQSSGHRCFS